MKIQKTINTCLFIVAILITNFASAQTNYEKDFEIFCKDVKENYAYFNQQQLNWDTVKKNIFSAGE